MMPKILACIIYAVQLVLSFTQGEGERIERLRMGCYTVDGGSLTHMYESVLLQTGNGYYYKTEFTVDACVSLCSSQDYKFAGVRYQLGEERKVTSKRWNGYQYETITEWKRDNLLLCACALGFREKHPATSCPYHCGETPQKWCILLTSRESRIYLYALSPDIASTGNRVVRTTPLIPPEKDDARVSTVGYDKIRQTNVNTYLILLGALLCSTMLVGVVFAIGYIRCNSNWFSHGN